MFSFMALLSNLFRLKFVLFSQRNLWPYVWFEGFGGLERVEPRWTHVWIGVEWNGINPGQNILLRREFILFVQIEGTVWVELGRAGLGERRCGAGERRGIRGDW